MRKKIFNILKKNLLYIFSLGLSFFLWFYVLNTEPLKIDQELHLEYILPKNYGIVEAPLNSIKISLLGPQAFVRTLEGQVLKSKIIVSQLTKLKKNEFIIKKSDLNLDLPLGVTIESWKKDDFIIKIGKLISKKIKVTPNIIGSIDENHRLITSKVEPEFVQIEAAASVISKLSKFQTNPVDISSLKGKGEVELTLKDLDGRIRFPKDEQIIFKYNIKPTKANLQINNVKIRFLSSRAIRSATTRKVSLLVLSEQGENVKIGSSDVKVIADVPENKKGRFEVKLQVKLPEGIHLLKILPEKVYVRVK